MPKDTPILMTRAMALATFEGRKTMTRRIMVPQLPDEPTKEAGKRWGLVDDDFYYCGVRCPYGKPGDRLWVREEHYQFGHWEPIPGETSRKTGRQKWRFVSDNDLVHFDPPVTDFRRGRHHSDPLTPAWHKRLARFMPRRVARISLEITKVRAERLQAISAEDVLAEGLIAWIDPPSSRATDVARETWGFRFRCVDAPDFFSNCFPVREGGQAPQKLCG